MKKFIVFALVLSVMATFLIACNKTPAQFKGEWKFSKISKVELRSDLSEDAIADLKLVYGDEDVKGVEKNALEKFTADGTFTPCYVNFESKFSYTYDPILEREAAWVFYQTGENEGFLSFYTELDASLGNPDPTNNPDVVYNAETDTLLVTLQYSAFMVTVEMSR
jgi:hypothetical protein